ncbi:prothrombin-like [Oryzias latipes]|uniref:prothrombin-like n=1 Tax=Oryzias latipes TaxID=8090 RepID=UPI000CE17F50|nr:prothrombin-like [Oryzias latipes]
MTAAPSYSQSTPIEEGGWGLTLQSPLGLDPHLLQHPGENRWYQIGIVWWRQGYDRNGIYGFYTHLFRMGRWIKKVIEKSGADDE